MASSIGNNPETGKFERQYSCNYCQLIRINGVVTHETGCTEAWKDYKLECSECGNEFKPEEKDQKYCSPCCENQYHGQSCYCDDCIGFDLEQLGDDEDDDEGDDLYGWEEFDEYQTFPDSEY